VYDVPKDLIEALQAAPDVLQGLLSDYTEDQARNARGGDEGWSVVEVVCHLRDVEERAVERVHAMRTQTEPFLAGYDQEALARERDYASANLHDALDAFVRQRRAHLAELAALAPTDWERTGQHEEQGRITIMAHTIHIAAHDALHAAQIARQLGDVPGAG
jgi:hypothetical protein